MHNGNEQSNSSYDPRNWFSVSKLYEQQEKSPVLSTGAHKSFDKWSSALLEKPAEKSADSSSFSCVSDGKVIREIHKKYVQDEYGTYVVETPIEQETFIPTPMQVTENKEDNKKDRDPMKLDHYIHALQKFMSSLPFEYQKKFPYDLICQLAHALLDGTVFEITKGLQDIQKITEENLNVKRGKLINGHRTLKNEIFKRQQREISSVQGKSHKKILLERQHTEEKQKFADQCEKELTSMDQKLVLELDRQASDQQATLQRAGLPLFFITNDPEDIKIQMYVLRFVMKLAME